MTSAFDYTIAYNKGISPLKKDKQYSIYEEQAGFEVYRLFVADMESPLLDELASAIVWLENHLAAGRKALVHCRYGIGRTGTFVLAYLIRSGETLKSAIACQSMASSPKKTLTR